MLDAYGGAALQGRQLTDYEWVCLWLNLDRTLAQKAWAAYEGIKLAFSKEGPPFPFVDSATRTPVEAAQLTYNLRTARVIADKLSGDGWD